ncbi:hypothetical protein, partial [Thermococcus sp.]|uniref:hypothetical protein n=1 Tax=Thermococcus sp. TaxID=35749 RepID=UPI0026079BF8
MPRRRGHHELKPISEFKPELKLVIELSLLQFEQLNVVHNDVQRGLKHDNNRADLLPALKGEGSNGLTPRQGRFGLRALIHLLLLPV